MTQTLSKFILFWLILPLIAFALLPAQALHYGLFNSTQEEILAAMGWSTANLSWAWFLPLLIYPTFKKPKTQLIFLVALTIFILLSATWAKLSFGYAVIVLFLAIWQLASQSLAKLKVMQGDRFIISALLLVVGLIGIFILFPTLTIFSSMLQDNGQFALDSSLRVFKQSQLPKVIWQSVSVSATVGLLATFFGLLFALYTTRLAKRTRFFGKIFSILPIVTPPFVVGLGTVLLLGRTGYVTTFLVEHLGFSPNWFYGFIGIATSHTLALTPMAFMIIEGALKAMPNQLEEASYTLRANRSQTFLYLIFPLLKPALANAFLITFVQSLADFSTPFVLGGNYDVLASQIYFYIAGSQPDYASASSLGAILLLFSLAIFLIQYRWLGKRSYVTVSGKNYQGRQQGLPSGLKWLIICILSLWGLFNTVLYGSIFYGSFVVNWGVDHTFTLSNYEQLFGRGLDYGGFPSLIQTVLYALVAAPITAVVGLLIAYLTTRKQFKGKGVLEFLTLLCFAVPGTVAGVSYLLAFNNAPIYLTGSSAIIVLSMVTRNMPNGMRASIAGLKQLDKSLEEASLTLKGNSFQTLIYVILPLLKSALLSALVTSFVRSMTTISAIVFLVTPSTRVATSYILSRVEDGDYGLAIAYGATLIVVMMSIILGFNKLIYRK